jgi:4'-phosphopantetheinyl transferase
MIQPAISLIVTRCEQVSDDLLGRYFDLLSDEERQRNQRYHFAQDRRRDLIARALLRTQLAERLSTEPQSLIFTRGKHGKPALVSSDPSASYLQFNLSHAGDWIVLALAGKPVGVDIEYTPRDNDVMAIADRYFFGNEINQLKSFNEDEQRQRFFDYWTLKEAYMKARGEGISLGLNNFGFSVVDSQNISIEMKPCLNDSPLDWQFLLGTLDPDYRLALAINSDVKPSLHCYECIPFKRINSLEGLDRLFK